MTAFILEIEDADIFRAASTLIRQYGREASRIAGSIVGELLAQGDLDGCAIWERVRREVSDLMRQEETIH
jgi:hypothetical protein